MVVLIVEPVAIIRLHELWDPAIAGLELIRLQASLLHLLLRIPLVTAMVVVGGAMRNPLVLGLAGLLVLVAAAARAHAQEKDTPTPVVPKQVVSTDPLWLSFGWLNGEYERKINSRSTWGVSWSSSARYTPSFRNVNLMLRYYPHGAALSGFYVGASAAGYATANRRIRVEAGYELGYAWLLGPQRNISLTLRGARPYGLPGPTLLFPRGNIGPFTVGFAF